MELSQSYKELGNTFYKKQQYTKAIDAYSKAISVKGNVPAFYSNRAAAYGAQQQYQKAINDCDKALELDPKFMRAHARKATYLLRQGKVDLAKDAVSKLTVRDPRRCVCVCVCVCVVVWLCVCVCVYVACLWSCFLLVAVVCGL